MSREVRRERGKSVNEKAIAVVIGAQSYWGLSKRLCGTP